MSPLLQLSNAPGEYQPSPEEIQRWDTGARAYKHCWNRISIKPEYSADEINSLKALFLGEKPACFGNPIVRDNPNIFQQYGFHVTGDYIYRPELISRILQEHKTIFEKENQKDPVVFMQEFAKISKETEHIKRGLLLGFPLSAAQGYALDEKVTPVRQRIFKFLRDNFPKEEDTFRTILLRTKDPEQLQGFLSKHREMNISEQEARPLLDSLKSTLVDIHGIRWVDYGGSSPESLQKQHRLKAALELSPGLLQLGQRTFAAIIRNRLVASIRRIFNRSRP